MSFKLPYWVTVLYSEKEPPWGPVGEVTYKRTYERDGEGWHDTVKRVVEGCYQAQENHCLKHDRPWDEEQALHSAIEMYDLIFNMKFLPPGRGLATMGTGLLESKGGAAANNCGFISTTDPTEALPWLMDMLMLGVGVGFDTKGAGISVPGPIRNPGYPFVEHTVGDSREGWVGALKDLLQSYLGGEDYASEFNYSEIRPKGAPIRGFGGTASGPGPLKELLEGTRTILERRVGAELQARDIVDIANLIGRCIVSGNIRRSAEIALGEPTEEFLDLKDYEKNPERAAFGWTSNNSVVCTRGMDYGEIAKRIALNGEPGVFWLENAQDYSRMGRRPDHVDRRAAGCNPCSEQTLESRELCCLVETFPSRHESYYEYQKTLKYAYLYAKSVTLIPTHCPETNAIIRRNRRIGCSMSGIVEACNKFGRNEFFTKWCDKGYKYITALDERYSEWLGVNRSNKRTSVKPSGTVSLLPGVSPGIHWPHSEHYFRVIRFASDSPYVEQLREAGYRCVDLAPGEPNTTAVYFAVKSENFERCKYEVSMWEQLEMVAAMQHHWADNQVSATVTFMEPEDIKPALELYEGRLKSVSFLPLKDHEYAHAPYQEVLKEEYDKYLAQLKPVVLQSVHEQDDKFCSSDKCEL